MSDFEKKAIEIDLDKEAEILAKKVGCTLDEANLFLDTKEEYLFKVGISYMPDEDNKNQSAEDDRDPVLDIKEMCEYIREKSGLSAELIDKLDEMEIEYYKAIGVIEE